MYILIHIYLQQQIARKEAMNSKERGKEPREGLEEKYN